VRPPSEPIDGLARGGPQPVLAQPTVIDLLGRLARDLKPVSRHAASTRLVAGLVPGFTVSLLLVELSLGYRPDIAAAAHTAMFWAKLAYTLAIGGLALGAVERLARPGTPILARALWLAAPVAAMALLAAWQLASAPGPERLAMTMGVSAAVCWWRIVAFSVPPFAGLVWAVRGLAPTRLGLAGGMVGLAAGGFGAGAYALSCVESTGPFLAIWYSLGLAACAAAGGLLGRRALRW